MSFPLKVLENGDLARVGSYKFVRIGNNHLRVQFFVHRAWSETTRISSHRRLFSLTTLPLKMKQVVCEQ